MRFHTWEGVGGGGGEEGRAGENNMYVLLVTAFVYEEWRVGRGECFATVTLSPHLDGPVPAARHDDGVLSVGREADTAHPISVAVVLGDRGRKKVCVCMCRCL